MENKIPVYKAVVGQGELSFVSLVDQPAIIEKGLAFSKEYDMQFKKDELKGIVVGPAMIPDMPLYRRDNELGEYVIVFTKESIEYFQEQFNKTNKEYKVNFDHDGVVESAFIKSNWLIEDEQYDKSRMYGFSYPVGTWMMEVKVNDKSFFEREVIKGGRFGFSVEGLFALEMTGEVIEKNKLQFMETNELLKKIAELEEKLAAFEKEKELSEKENEELVEKEEELSSPEKEELGYKDKEEMDTDEVEDKKDEEMVEDAETEEVSNNVMDDVMAVINPKFEEIYNMIAELKNEIANGEKEEATEELSTNQFEQKLSAMRFITQNNLLNFN